MIHANGIELRTFFTVDNGIDYLPTRRGLYVNDAGAGKLVEELLKYYEQVSY